jgi:hypothetical protein
MIMDNASYHSILLNNFNKLNVWNYWLAQSEQNNIRSSQDQSGIASAC